MTPKATVLMPAYNVAPYIGEAIESVLQQTFSDFEFLIIDDGSTDKTWEVIQSFRDSRIRPLRSEKNQGLVPQLNRGIDEARGEYILRLDADDIALPTRFEKQVKFMDAHPEVGLCGTWAEHFGSQSWFNRPPATHEETAMYLFNGTTVIHSSAIIRKEVLSRYNLYYDAHFKDVEDYELWLRMLKVTRMANIQEVLIRVRHHSGSVSAIYEEEQMDRVDRLRLGYFSAFLERSFSPFEEKMINFRLDYNQPLDLKAINQFFREIKERNRSKNWFDETMLDPFFCKRILANAHHTRSENFFFWWNLLRLSFFFPKSKEQVRRIVRKRTKRQITSLKRYFSKKLKRYNPLTLLAP